MPPDTYPLSWRRKTFFPRLGTIKSGKTIPTRFIVCTWLYDDPHVFKHWKNVSISNTRQNDQYQCTTDDAPSQVQHTANPLRSPLHLKLSSNPSLPKAAEQFYLPPKVH